MPTIAFDSGFSKLEKTILSKTFKANCQKLGLHKHDFFVQVRKADIGPPQHYARVAHPGGKDFFHVEINENGFNLFDASSSLGHETIHMKQYVSGALKDDRRGGSYWHDAHYDPLIVMISGNDVPWEQEAWALQGEVHKHAVASLTPEERKHIDHKHSHGLNRLWK